MFAAERFVGGYIADPKDDRDRVWMPRAARFSGSMVLLPQTTPISDQGSLSSCVANATCDALELLTQTPVQLSRLTLYWLARDTHGDACRDEGTFIRAAFGVLRRLGIPREDLWPYIEANVNVRPPILALQSGWDHRLDGFERIVARGSARGDEVEAAIRSGHPVVFAVEVGKPFAEYSGGDVAFDAPARSIGGHAMVIVGVRRTSTRRLFLVRNSWGEDWGLREIHGHAWISEEYLATATDLWVPTQAVDFSEVP